MRDLKIINARIPDYEQDCIREAELLIRDGKIEKIRERGAITEETAETIDAKGQIVSAGFVDTTPMRMHRREISLRRMLSQDGGYYQNRRKLR